ncbi:MAG: ATP-dependent Clp protease proteolytic subunit [Planctomycetes bacterium]|nr:ATP-dependent Clp protease proteolytic subunit [Planctomycetota bacterium]
MNDRELELVIKSRTIVISEDVNSSMAGEISRLVNYMEAESPSDPILVTINSPGGEAYTGLGIHDTLRATSCPVFTLVNGLCASAGIVILLAAEKENRYSLPSSRFMIHQPSGGASGTAADIEIKAENMKALRHMYFEIIAKACGRTVEEVSEKAKRDFWLSSEESRSYGLIDKIITKKAEIWRTRR